MQIIRRHIRTAIVAGILAVTLALTANAHWRISNLETNVAYLRHDVAVTWERAREGAWVAGKVERRTELMSDNLRWLNDTVQALPTASP